MITQPRLDPDRAIRDNSADRRSTGALCRNFAAGSNRRSRRIMLAAPIECRRLLGRPFT
jgi:hypothetical protein